MTYSRNAFGLGGAGGSCAAQAVTATRARQTDNTRRALIRAGRRALARGQAERIGIASLVRDAGLGTGTFYNYFDGKPQFFEAVMHAVVDELAAASAALQVWQRDPASYTVLLDSFAHQLLTILGPMPGPPTEQ